MDTALVSELLSYSCMRKIIAIFFPLALLLFVQTAHANRSSFKVQDVKQVGNNYEVTVASNHFGKTTNVQFFAHATTPDHNSAKVLAGVPMGEVQMQAGNESHTLTVPKAVVDGLKLKAGADLHVAAFWPAYGHMWGTPNTAGGAHNVGTSFKIPSKLAGAAPAAEVAETFPNGMPLHYGKPLWKGAKAAKAGTAAVEGKATSALGQHADIASLEHNARNFSEAGSLLESEGKVGIRKKKHLRRTIALLKKMARNPKHAESVLGKGWSIQYTATYVFADKYMDNKSMDLAQTEGGLRHRSVPGSGQPAQLNYKDPKGIRNGPDGVVMSRTERFITVGNNPNLKELVQTDNILNPMHNVLQAGKNPQSFLNQAAIVPDKRVRFQLLFAEPGGKPQPVAEISADHVHNFESQMGSAKHKKVSFFGLEVDIAHQPVDGSGKAVDFIPGVKNWVPTHKPSDLQHLDKDKSIQKTYVTIGKMMDHLVNNGVELRATVPKYTEGLLRSGVLKPTTEMQRNILRRNRGSFLRAKSPISRVQRVRAKAAAPVRAR